MTMTELSDTESGLQLPTISSSQDQTLLPPHQHVSYLAVPSSLRQKQNVDSATRRQVSTPSSQNETTTATSPFHNKPIPTFGVGKKAPRGFPSLASRTKCSGHPSQLRRYSLPRTKYLDDRSKRHEDTPTALTPEFNTTVLSIPTLYLPNDGEDGDASDMVTIPSSYMLPSVQGQTEVRFESSDQGSLDGRDKDSRYGDYLQARRGSSVSAVYRPHQDTTPTLQDVVEEELEKNLKELKESTEEDGEDEMEGESSCSEGDGNEGEPTSPGNTSQIDKSETIALQPCPADGKESVHHEEDTSVVSPQPPPTGKTVMEETSFIDPIRNSRRMLDHRNKTTRVKVHEKPAEEEDFDPLSIIRASMNRMKRREAGVAGSITDKSDATVVQPLTLVSLQRSHLLLSRPGLAMIATEGMRRPEIDTSGLPEIPGQEVGTGYLSLEKFTFVCSWLKTVEGFRDQGLLDGDMVSDSELAWTFSSDYTPNMGNLELHRGSV